MSYPNYRIQFRALAQERDVSDDAYLDLISVWEPEALVSKAIELGAWQRCRELTCPQDLLRGLLYRACWNRSYDQVAAWATLKGIACLSGEGWRKRFVQSASWIDWLLSQLLWVHQRPEWLSPTAGRLLLVDATREGTVAGTGDDVRLHWCYDVLAGQSVQIAISDRYHAEGLGWFQLQAGDVVVTDAGYPVGSTVQLAKAQQADCITRVSSSHLRLESQDGQRIDLKKRLCRQRYSSAQQLSGWVCSPSGERLPVRLVAYRLPRELSQQAQRRKEQQLRAKRGRQFNRELVWWAGWVLLVTTLPQDQWSDELIARIYRARWQIELVFKRLKSGLDWHRIEIKAWGRLKIEVQLKLIVWLLQEQQQQQIREQLMALLHEPALEGLPHEDEEQDQAAWVPSSWALTMQTLDWLAAVVRGSWSARRFGACLPLMARYWGSPARRKRPHQETSMRDWITQRFSSRAILPAAELGA
jgi:Transposase DDE domain